MDALTRIATTLADGWNVERERSARLERMQGERFKSVDQQRQFEELTKQRDQLEARCARMTSALESIREFAGTPGGSSVRSLVECHRLASEALS